MADSIQQRLEHRWRSTDPMQRRIFLATSAAALMLRRLPAEAAATGDDGKKFIHALGAAAIGSLTGSNLSQPERETRFRGLLEAHFDMPGIERFVLGRYWKI